MSFVHLILTRKLIGHFYRSYFAKLTAEQKRLVGTLDKVFCAYAIAVTIKEEVLQAVYTQKCCLVDYTMGLIGENRCFINNILCFQINYILNKLFYTIVMYLISYLVFHLNKVNLVTSLEEMIIGGDYSLVFLLTSQVDELNLLFDSVFSPILCMNLFCNSIQVTRILYMSIIPSTWKSETFRAFYISDSIDILAIMVFNLGTVVAISRMQEKIRLRVDKLIRILRYQGMKDEYSNKYSLLSETIDQSFTLPVTVWGLVPVNRSLLLSLISSYIVFPVLLVQINNGALGKH